MTGDTGGTGDARREVPGAISPGNDLTMGVILAAVAIGGALGSAGRYALAPHGRVGESLTTWAINVGGCLAIGALIAWVTLRRPHPLLRPALGTGALGGFTTFSAYEWHIYEHLARGDLALGLALAIGTPLGAVAAAWAGDRGMRRLMSEPMS